MENTTIFISIDSSFFRLSLEFLKNIKKNYPAHPLIHVCHTNLSDSQMKKMKQIDNNIKFITNTIDPRMVGPIMIHLNKKEFNPKVFYARFLIWNDYFRQFDKILHLDVDIFILKPLDCIFEKEDFFIVRDVYEGHDFKDLSDMNLQKELQNDKLLEIPYGSNAGIFLVTKRYLNDAVLDSFVDIKNRYENFIRFADQSIISIWMKKNNILPSEDYSYNYQFRLFFMNPDNLYIKHPSIIHLNGLTLFYKLWLLRLFNLGFFKGFVYINTMTKGLLSKLIF